MFSLVIPNFTPASTRSFKGFSLIELLVAISLLSIVMIGGFAIFNLIQEMKSPVRRRYDVLLERWNSSSGFSNIAAGS